MTQKRGGKVHSLIQWFRSLSLAKRVSLIALLFSAMACTLQITFVVLFPSQSLFSNLNQYVNHTAGFAVSYPSNWLLLEIHNDDRNASSVVVNMSGFKFFCPAVSMNISRSSATYTSLTQVGEWEEQNSSRWLGYQDVSSSNLNAKGEDTLLHEYTAQLAKSPLCGDASLHCLDNDRLHDGHGYIISLCAYSDDLFVQARSTFEKIIASFSYLN